MTTEEHKKQLSEKFIEKLKFNQLNNNLKQKPSSFKVNVIELLKLMNFQENRKITSKQNIKATGYLKKINNIIHSKKTETKKEN